MPKNKETGGEGIKPSLSKKERSEKTMDFIKHNAHLKHAEASEKPPWGKAEHIDGKHINKETSRRFLEDTKKQDPEYFGTLEGRLAKLEERMDNSDTPLGKAKRLMDRLMDTELHLYDFHVLTEIDTKYTGSADKEKAKQELTNFAISFEHAIKEKNIKKYEASQRSLIEAIEKNDAVEWVVKKIIEQKQSNPFTVKEQSEGISTTEVVEQTGESLTQKQKTIDNSRYIDALQNEESNPDKDRRAKELSVMRNYHLNDINNLETTFSSYVGVRELCEKWIYFGGKSNDSYYEKHGDLDTNSNTNDDIAIKAAKDLRNLLNGKPMQKNARTSQAREELNTAFRNAGLE